MRLVNPNIESEEQESGMEVCANSIYIMHDILGGTWRIQLRIVKKDRLVLADSNTTY